MKKHAKKLSLSRETLRNLQDSELGLVIGGQGLDPFVRGFPSVELCPTPPAPDDGIIDGDIGRGRG